tara:strand:+ start:293 stop:439 length:147 start_codon:yes stop_codon:yes gene_type:complete
VQETAVRLSAKKMETLEQQLTASVMAQKFAVRTTVISIATQNGLAAAQ